MSSLRFGNIIICEYAARGENHKNTLVNIFSGDIIVAEMPAFLRLGLYIEYIIGNNGPSEIMVDVIVGSKTIGVLRAKLSRAGEAKIFPLLSNIDVIIDKNSEIELVAYAEGTKREKILSKMVRKGTIPSLPPTASPPPS